MLIELFQKGGPMMWPLLACSLLSLTISIERLSFWLVRARRRRSIELDAVLELSTGPREAALTAARECQDPAAGVLVAGLGHNLAAEAMENAAIGLLKSSRRGLKALDTIVTIAPMLGLLGTVTGVIRSFGFFHASGTVDMALLGSGFAEALLTTAFGLSIAILTVVPYNFFRARVQQESEYLSAIGTELEERLSSREKDGDTT
ncbi:MAG TPA: MotA/TolQ/ExbB proton channel family protein [Spirochaetia bacterium]|nr:MotA/TolQ/ExbB proton channel family protein [Spirochaetia bacterium]